MSADVATMWGHVLAFAVRGVLIYFLWNWVAVDALHLPSISVGHAYGLRLLYVMIARNSSNTTQG